MSSDRLLSLVVILELTEVNEPDIAVASCAELDTAPLKIPENDSAVTLPLVDIEPVTWRLLLAIIEPVNSCLSVKSSPNLLEPLEKIIEADVNSVWNSCAVNLPVNVKLPLIVASANSVAIWPEPLINIDAVGIPKVNDALPLTVVQKLL